MHSLSDFFRFLQRDLKRNQVSTLRLCISMVFPTSFNALIWLRLYQLLRAYRLPASPVMAYLRFVHQLQVDGDCRIGPGLYMPHPLGIAMNNTQIGENCDIYGSVVLMNYFGQGPRIGDSCKLGNGCRILGGGEERENWSAY